ncbi:hypothetical protein FISHEDRAFT_49815, partial [Fistulina hepatica ATCC 64428]
GWISLACWIVVFTPQLYENYTLQSGEGLSLLFIVIWLVGDISNFAGAVIAHLLPTVIIIAVYYLLCDALILTQVYYYRWKRRNATTVASRSETDPLLPGNTTANAGQRDPPASVYVARYLGALAFICFVGICAWLVSNRIGHDDDGAPDPPISTATAWVVQILGWTSALCYLGARIPQILKNFKTRCQGLAPAMFFFSICGNVTYVLSICSASMAKDYLIKNAAWLAGSGLTVFLDVFVLSQFFFYRSVDRLPASRHD